MNSVPVLRNRRNVDYDFESEPLISDNKDDAVGKIKRAVGAVDKLSIRLGVLLKRYPTLRLLGLYSIFQAHILKLNLHFGNRIALYWIIECEYSDSLYDNVAYLDFRCASDVRTRNTFAYIGFGPYFSTSSSCRGYRQTTAWRRLRMPHTIYVF